MDRHIFLIGMPACGKSALGRRVAQKLGLPYLDTDVYLTETTGMDTMQLLQKYGNTAYRDAETNLLMQLVNATPGIISTGGGMCLREENQKIMKNHGVIVLIDRPVDEIMMNIREDKRPILAQMGREGVEAAYNERMPIYRSLADAVMDNGTGMQSGLASLESIVRFYL